MTLGEKLDLRLNIWFALSKRQQRRISELGYNVQLENIPMSHWYSITKNQKLTAMLIALKRSRLRLVA